MKEGLNKGKGKEKSPQQPQLLLETQTLRIS